MQSPASTEGQVGVTYYWENESLIENARPRTSRRARIPGVGTVNRIPRVGTVNRIPRFRTPNRIATKSTPNVDINLSALLLTLFCFGFTAFLWFAGCFISWCLNLLSSIGLFGEMPEPAEMRVHEEGGPVQRSPWDRNRSAADQPRKLIIPTKEEWAKMTKRSRTPIFTYTGPIKDEFVDTS